MKMTAWEEELWAKEQALIQTLSDDHHISCFKAYEILKELEFFKMIDKKNYNLLNVDRDKYGFNRVLKMSKNGGK